MPSGQKDIRFFFCCCCTPKFSVYSQNLLKKTLVRKRKNWWKINVFQESLWINRWIPWFYSEINVFNGEFSFLIICNSDLKSHLALDVYMLSVLSSWNFYYISTYMNVKGKEASYMKTTVIWGLVWYLFLTSVGPLVSPYLSFPTQTMEIYAFLIIAWGCVRRNTWSSYTKKCHQITGWLLWANIGIDALL